MQMRKYTEIEETLLRRLSREHADIKTIMRLTGRTAGALRHRASKLGISLGHQRRRARHQPDEQGK